MANSYMPSGNWSFELFVVWYGSSPYFLYFPYYVNPQISINPHKSIYPQIKSKKLNPQISGSPWNPWISVKSVEKYSDLSEIPRLFLSFQINLSFYQKSVSVFPAASIELFNCLRFWSYIIFYGFLNFCLSYFEGGGTVKTPLLFPHLLWVLGW